MHALACAIGPDFHEGQIRVLPSGATDIAPTVLALLGIERPTWMDGRVLWEAMKSPSGEPPAPVDEVIEPTNRHAGGFHPVLTLHRAGMSSYVHAVSNGRGD